MAVEVRSIEIAPTSQPAERAGALQEKFKYATPAGGRLVQVIDSGTPGFLLAFFDVPDGPLVS